MLNHPRRQPLLIALIVALGIAAAGFAAYQVRQAVLFARNSVTEREIVCEWSWTYISGVGRMVFSADRRVKEGFPPDDPDEPAVRDRDFTYLLSGTWRVEGDILVTDIDNGLLLKSWSGTLDKPEFYRKLRRDRIVRLDDDQIVFEEGSPLKRVKR